MNDDTYLEIIAKYGFDVTPHQEPVRLNTEAEWVRWLAESDPGITAGASQLTPPSAVNADRIRGMLSQLNVALGCWKQATDEMLAMPPDQKPSACYEAVATLAGMEHKMTEGAFRVVSRALEEDQGEWERVERFHDEKYEYVVYRRMRAGG